MSVPFWKPPSESYPGLLPDRADVLVIGGGIAGTSLMHHLAKRRFSAVLVERHHLAAGASGRNAGFLLAGVADCYAEAVRIFGRERWDLTQLRRHFGVVGAGLMGAELPGERTAVTTGLDAVTAGFFSASTLWPNLHVTGEMRLRAAEALERMEATHLGEQLVGTMSAGEKRRILIARALVHRPRQLLLDEPSNALDLAAQRELRETLRRLAQEGTGLVLVTHHLGDILPEIERVILMRDGRIVADGPRTELLTEARLSELFNVPVRIGRDEEWLHSW